MRPYVAGRLPCGLHLFLPSRDLFARYYRFHTSVYTAVAVFSPSPTLLGLCGARPICCRRWFHAPTYLPTCSSLFHLLPTSRSVSGESGDHDVLTCFGLVVLWCGACLSACCLSSLICFCCADGCCLSCGLMVDRSCAGSRCSIRLSRHWKSWNVGDSSTYCFLRSISLWLGLISDNDTFSRPTGFTIYGGLVT